MKQFCPGFFVLATPLLLTLSPMALLSQEAPPPVPAPALPSAAPVTPPATETGNTSAVPLPTPVPSPEEAWLVELRKESSRMAAERDRLVTENAIAKEKLTKELSERRAELERQSLRAEEEKATLTRELDKARMAAERDMAMMKLESDRLALEMAISKSKAELQANEQRLADAEARTGISRMSVAIEQKEKELVAAQYAESSPVYLEDPLVDGTLVISDRRIELNGPIVSRTADEIAERIDYYNNKNDRFPIFIVIDNSPGGSVMAGYKILESMKGSKAPVYVVLKSFAASMAACITTTADRSFAYPNAVILHHQLSSSSFGNLTQQRESLEEIEEWWKRLAGPIAKKMGISTEDFIKKMYDKVSTGDWTEFADNAKALHWVDEVVNNVKETGQLKHPDLPSAVPKPAPTTIILPTRGSEAPAATVVPVMAEVLDQKGRPFFLLPRPNPKDVYYLYNPDGYYRLP